MSDTVTATIRNLNDRFRQGDPKIPGQFIITRGIDTLLDEHDRPMGQLAREVQYFDRFTEENDPYDQHDFGAFEFLGQTCFWKIDIYDKTLKWGAEDPTDLSNSCRVLTIMLAHEY